MSITVDVTDLGGALIDTAATSIPFTTGTAVAAGAKIVVFVTCSNTATLSSVSGGGLTWTVDKTGSSTFFNIAIASANAPAGLASGTTITANLSGSVSGRSIQGASFVGSSPLVVDTTANATAFSTAAWSSATITMAANACFVVGNIDQDALTTMTVTAPATENNDRGVAGFSAGMANLIITTGGSKSIAGTRSAADSGSTLGVSYVESGAAVATSAPRSVWPIMLAKFHRIGQPWQGFLPPVPVFVPADVTVPVTAAVGLGVAPSPPVLVTVAPAASVALGVTPAALPVDVSVVTSAVAIGSAPAPVVNVVTPTTAAVANGSSPPPVPLVVVPVTAALALGITPAPTVIAGSGSTVNPAAALALGIAPAPLVLVTVPITSAVANGSAPAPVIAGAVPVTAALALGSAPAPVKLVVIPVNAAVALGIAPAPTVIAGSGSTVSPAAALALGSTPAPAVLVQVLTTASTAIGTAPAAQPGKTIPVTAATALGAVLSPVLRVLVFPSASVALGVTPTPTSIAGVFFVPAAVTVTDSGLVVVTITPAATNTVNVADTTAREVTMTNTNTSNVTVTANGTTMMIKDLAP